MNKTLMRSSQSFVMPVFLIAILMLIGIFVVLQFLTTSPSEPTPTTDASLSSANFSTPLPPLITLTSIFPDVLAETPTLAPSFATINPTFLPGEIPDLATPLLSLPPEQQEKIIFHGDRSRSVVALTFDLCETADNPSGYDSEIVRILNETETPATFFASGLWMAHNQQNIYELGNNPLFEIGNHAWSHLDFAQISPQEMEREILLAQQTMFESLGRETKLFRLPYGTYTEEALDVIAQQGMLTIQWDVVSGDPDPNVLAGPMADWVVGQTQPGSIIIMHANGRGWHTAEALPIIITSLREQGYTFVTVSDLLSLESP